VAQRSTVTITNSTIAGNTAGSGAMGSGIHVADGSVISAGGTLTLLNSTVASNQTAGSGGGLWVGATRTQVRLANTIIARNTAVTGGPDVWGTLLTTSAYNLIGDGSGLSGISHGQNGNQVGTAASPIDPQLGPLQNNGGPTPTMALLPGSPALDRGDPAFAPPPATDQRGLPRVVASTIDIGAFEVQIGAATQLVLTAPTGVTAGSPFDVTVTARDAYGHVATGYAGTVTFTAGDTDPGVVLPAAYTFTADDQGVHAFAGGFTLFTPGDQSLTAEDLASGLSVRVTLRVEL
jgi:hypothetical protein